MDMGLLAENLLSAPILFFGLGLFAGFVRSDLAIPEAVTKLLSLYLLWSIGLKGGVQIRDSAITPDAVLGLAIAIGFACTVPFVVFALLRRKLGPDNAAALAAVYGSVSAVTFLTSAAYLNRLGEPYGGHMVAALALMESPAIIISLLLLRPWRAKAPAGIPGANHQGVGASLREATLNGPVVLLTGSMLVGAVIGPSGFAAVKPLATDLFPGVLAFFLLELGLVAAKRSRSLRVVGWPLVAFAVILPVVNATAALVLCRAAGLGRGDSLLLTMLAASASYIAAPAVARTAIPRASPGIYIPLALTITFPLNIAFGLPLYWEIIKRFWPV
ncbi:MAG: sodium-dependent bicarbonate transport family permease [Phycisphaerales bacterium]|nr:sodium-dependent bicarbonate transport family permease [Phycisphaerales bacterium]